MEDSLLDELQQQLLSITTTAVQEKKDIDDFLNSVSKAGPPEKVSVALVGVFWLLWIKLEGTPDQRLKLIEFVTECVKLKKVDAKLCMESFDNDFMAVCGLIVSADNWKKREIRFNTKATYMQHKYNLLREDSEGYAKLVTALNDHGLGSLKASSVPALMKEVTALVGFFDLDPNRVLDLVLEAFEQQPSNTAYLDLIPYFNKEGVVHLVGFKFQQYHARPGTPDKAAPSPAPRALYQVAAQLIAAELISLTDLLSHMAPSEDSLRKLAEAASTALKAEVDRIGVVKLAASSVDEMVKGRDDAALAANANRKTGISAAQQELDARPYESLLLTNELSTAQSLGLVEALLEVGAWPAATRLCERLSALGVPAAANPEIGSALRKLIGKELEPTYAALYPEGLLSPSILMLPPDDVTPGPPLSSALFDQLRLLGLYLYQEPILLAKVVRVLKHHFVFYATPPALPTEEEEAAAAQAEQKIEAVLIHVLLPALTMLPCHVGTGSEVWGLLQMFSFTQRYHIYGEFKELMEASPLLTAASKLVITETKKILRRLAMPENRRDRKEGMRPFGRLMGKAANTVPLAVAEVCLAQVEAYSNMVEPVVESFKYLTPMALDMMIYVILTRLTMDRAKVKDDGVHISDWLQALATFVGAVYKRHTSLDVTALLTYLANALRKGDAFDMLVLKELLAQMAGITLVSDLSEAQVEAVAGSELLQAEVVFGGMAAVNVKQAQRGKQRLMDGLTRGPSASHLALPFLILTGQQRHVVMTSTEASQVKFLVELYDKVHETCLLYSEFLRSATTFEEYLALLPPLEVLRTEYGLDPEYVFHLYRPVLSRLQAAEPAAEDGEIEDGEEGSAEAPSRKVESMNIDGAAAENPGVPGMTWSSAIASVKRSGIDPAVWQALTPDLYLLFWSLSLYDVQVPTKRYEMTHAHLRAELRSKDDAYAALKNQPPDLATQEDDLSVIRKEKQRIQEALEKLPLDCQAQTKRVEEVTARFAREKDTLMAGTLERKSFGRYFIQECILPRLLFSPADALYAARFMTMMHNARVTGFSTIWYLNQLMRDAFAAIKVVTDREASNLAIFLYETLKTLMHWMSSPAIYKEASAKPGFSVSIQATENEKRTDYAQFQKLMLKWHSQHLALFRQFIESGDYVPIRNTLIVLNRILPYFPSVDRIASSLKGLVEKVREKDPRDDIRTMATRYVSQLSAEIQKEGRMKTQTEFGGPLAGQTQTRAPPAAAVRKPDTKTTTTTPPTSPSTTAPKRTVPAPKPPTAPNANPSGTTGGAGASVNQKLEAQPVVPHGSSAGVGEGEVDNRGSKRVKVEKEAEGDAEAGKHERDRDTTTRSKAEITGTKRSRDPETPATLEAKEAKRTARDRNGVIEKEDAARSSPRPERTRDRSRDAGERKRGEDEGTGARYEPRGHEREDHADAKHERGEVLEEGEKEREKERKDKAKEDRDRSREPSSNHSDRREAGETRREEGEAPRKRREADVGNAAPTPVATRHSSERRKDGADGGQSGAAISPEGPGTREVLPRSNSAQRSAPRVLNTAPEATAGHARAPSREAPPQPQARRKAR